MSDSLRFKNLSVELSLGLSPQALAAYSVANTVDIVNTLGDKITTMMLTNGASQVERQGLRCRGDFPTAPLIQGHGMLQEVQGLFESLTVRGVHLFDAQFQYTLLEDAALLTLMRQHAGNVKHQPLKLSGIPTASYFVGLHEAWCVDDEGNPVPSMLVGGPEYSWLGSGYDIEAEPFDNWAAHLPEGRYWNVPVTLLIPKDDND